jgi:RND family efflux transporter MFP subunit
MQRDLNFVLKLGLATSVAALLTASCSQKPETAESHSHDSHGGHEDEPKTAQITFWADRHELFIEHRLVVAGSPTRFVTHVTDLRTFEPRTEGPIRFVLRLGQEPPIEHLEKAPSRAGIYEPSLVFPKPGDWDVSVVIPGESGESVVVLPKLRVYPDAHEVEHAEVPPAPEGISFLKEQQWKLKLGTSTPSKRHLIERVELPARTMPKPGLSATVIAPISGQLLAPPEGSLPLPGQKVEPGQLLALIQPVFSDAAARIAEAESELARSKVAAEQAEAVFNRVRKLAAAEAKSERELQEAAAAFATAKTRYEAAVALQSTYRKAGVGAASRSDGLPAIELRAPIGGVINSVGAGLGEPLAAERTLLTILNPDTLWIEAPVPETLVSRLSAGKGASYELPGIRGQFHDVSAGGGKLVFAGLQVDPATKTIPLIYEVNNAEGRLRVGQSLIVHVETANAAEALAIPDTAVVDEDGKPVVFVQVSGETFEKRSIVPGIRDGNWLQVLDGLKEGEHVVVQQAYAVRLASVSSAIPAHGHVH